MKDNKYKSRDVNFIGTITDSGETIINHNGRILQDALDRIEQLESQKIGHWIPVSERLPEFGQDVLLSLRSLDIKTGFRAKTEPYFYCHGVDSCYIEPQNVLAWMPLPQPYNAESEE